MRPTQDRTRETLFNWLSPCITDSLCLDLFAGSGILGLEALSRGAHKVVALEKNPTHYKNICQLQEDFAAKLICIHSDAISWLKQAAATANQQSYDIVFLDPPYGEDYITACLPSICSLLKPRGLVYYEDSEKPTLNSSLPLEFWREKSSGKKHFGILKKTGE